VASAFTEGLEIGGRPSGHAVAVLVPHIPARRQLDAADRVGMVGAGGLSSE